MNRITHRGHHASSFRRLDIQLHRIITSFLSRNNGFEIFLIRLSKQSLQRYHHPFFLFYDSLVKQFLHLEHIRSKNHRDRTVALNYLKYRITVEAAAKGRNYLLPSNTIKRHTFRVTYIQDIPLDRNLGNLNLRHRAVNILKKRGKASRDKPFTSDFAHTSHNLRLFLSKYHIEYVP
ncbi:unknown [Bacteroides sp. CAG:1060]|nr:unknown [Bacteroides sp. CAG:1060]